MKKILSLSAFAILLSCSITAQITIEAGDITPVGITAIQTTDTLPDASIEAGGAGMLIWDFSALANHEESTFTFENAANTPYGSFFPTANLAVEQDTLGWLYFALDNQSLRIVGTYAHVQYDTLELEVGFTLSPEQSIIRFPATYGDEYTELIKRSLQIPGSLIGFPVDSVKIVTTVNHHVNIDAYGPVTTPNNTYECLRSTETDISIDSTFIKFAGVWQFAEGSQPDTAINYNWWTNQNGLGFPVVNIDLQAANGTRTATWLKEFVTPAAEILPAPTSLRAYPNPTSGQLSVELQSATKGSLSLYGVNGKELLSKPIGQQVETLDVSGLPAGHYILILKNSTGRTTGSQQVEIAR